MKFNLVAIFIVFLSLSVNAQIDNKNKPLVIPSVESNKDTIDIPSINPSKSIESKSLDVEKSKTYPKLELPKKEFSMFPEEQFGNPGELYEKQINNTIKDLKLSPEEVEKRNGSMTDQFLGDFKTKALFVNVIYRDHGYVDGDLIQVRVNDDVIHPRVFLSGGYSGFKLNLNPGINKIDFVALNQGESGPNTAEFKVIDDNGFIVSHNQWNLATGVKATIIVLKE